MNKLKLIFNDIFAHIYILYTYIHIYITYIHIYIYMCVYIYICIYIYVCVYIHTYLHFGYTFIYLFSSLVCVCVCVCLMGPFWKIKNLADWYEGLFMQMGHYLSFSKVVLLPSENKKKWPRICNICVIKISTGC